MKRLIDYLFFFLPNNTWEFQKLPAYGLMYNNMYFLQQSIENVMYVNIHR